MAFTPLRLALGSLCATVILGITDKIPLTEPWKGFIEPTAHHLILDFQILTVGAFLLMVIWDTLEREIKPLALKGFSKTENILSKGFDDVKVILGDGFKNIEKVLSDRVGAIPGALSVAFERALQELAQTHLKTPGVKELVKKGKIAEAIEKVSDTEEDQVLKVREEISVLLHSQETKDWDEVSALLDAHPESRTCAFYVTLAFLYWNGGEVDRAIEVGEKGLALAHAKEEDFLPKFYNSLAYYYADGNRTERESEARLFAVRASFVRPMDNQPRDTEGYVLITFGKTPEEIQAGVALCHDAMCKGTPFEYYAKHVAKAHARLAALKPKEN